MSSLQGTLRAGRRTKELIKLLRPGDIALIHHADLDAMAARALIDCRVSAVANAARSITGRYPNQGPGMLVDAGVLLLDDLGDAFFDAASALDGAQATIEGNRIRVGKDCSAEGVLLSPDEVARRVADARGNLSAELDAFARNTLAYLQEEKALLLDPVGVPELATRIRGRHAMIVVRGEGYREDLRAIASYLHDVRPTMIGVDGGADALLELGMRPDIIIGDMDSVSDAALRSGAEIVVHGYVRGKRDAPGLRRLNELGISAKTFHVPGTSEDAAMLLADEHGASLIVAVGTHFSLIDFLDKGRGGMASTFLVRLRIGAKLVDAKGIGRLWAERRRPAGIEILLLTLAALFPIGVIAWHSPLLRTVANALRLWLRSVTGLR